MHTRSPWGGTMDLPSDPSPDDELRSQGLDRAALHSSMDLEETHNSWLLGTGDAAAKKKKYVDLGCVVCSRKLFKTLLASFVAAAIVAGIITAIVLTLPSNKPSPLVESNYTQALHKALLFFNAQKSGKLPKANNISWRGDSGLKDGSLQSQNLVGGYYNGGDNIKYGFPGAFTITMLSWSVIEYSAKYEAIGELEHIKELIKWGTDYMLQTFNVSAPRIDFLWAQVGKDGGPNDTTPNDGHCWEKPEDMDYDRPAYQCSECSDLGAEMASALAAASIVFKLDRDYSSKLVKGAALLWDFSREKRGSYLSSVPDYSEIKYNSTNYFDEFAWGGAWMYFATGNSSYLYVATQQGIADKARKTDLDFSLFDWNNKLPGAQILLTRLRILLNPGNPYEDLLMQYNNHTNIAMCSYLPLYQTFNRTKGGLALFNYGKPAPLQYAAAAAFLSTLYADYLSLADIPGWYCGPTFYPTDTLKDFARSQIDYILGKNPQNMSYVVGYGARYPLQVNHRGASIPKGKSSRGCTTAYNYRDTKSANPHVLVGAMVGGPDSKDGFQDSRTNANYTEPTISSNAFLTAALISLSGEDTASIDRNTIFSSVPPLYPPAPPPPSPWTP